MEAVDPSQVVGTVGDGRYRIEGLLGQGAVGAVYRAIDLTTGQRVALKQWHAGMLNEEVRGRFVREATALTTLDHPNIVKVVGYGFIDGVPFVALEFLDGQTVEAMLAGGQPLAPELAIALARQAIAAIAYAHARQIVHRDIKPENLFVVRDEQGKPAVKVLDYGLAKFMSTDTLKDSLVGSAATPLTAAGMQIGTPLYMPPEQAAGSSIDLQVDVYSMGCVLFEMLTGRPPYLYDTNLELMNAHLRAPIPKLDEALFDVRVAPELQALIDCALAKRQTERYPNAGAMLQALDALPPSPIVSTKQPAAAPAQHAPIEPAEQPGGTPFFIVCALLVGAALLLFRFC